MEAEPEPKNGFLSDKVRDYDTVLAKVLGVAGPQKLIASVLKIYSTRHGIVAANAGNEIEFIHSPGNWGEQILQVGETALIFIKAISGRLYEHSKRGHILVEEIDGSDHAIFPIPELWKNGPIPSIIRDNAQPYPGRPDTSAVPFGTIEQYVSTFIADLERYIFVTIQGVRCFLMEKEKWRAWLVNLRTNCSRFWPIGALS